MNYPHSTLPTKRTRVRKGMMKRLHAITKKNRKQRVAATAMAGDFDSEVPGRKIGMALAVIVGVHIVAAGLVFFHHWRLEGKGTSAPVSKVTTPPPAPVVPLPARSTAPRIEEMHAVRNGETYASIATRHNVDEQALREANLNAEGQVTPLVGGLIVKIPAKKIVMVEPKEVAEIQANLPPADRGIIEFPKATVVEEAPVLVKPQRRSATETTASRPAAAQPPKATVVKSAERSAAAKPVSRNYTVKAGDNLSKISTRMKVSQAALMKANGIKDPNKLRIGTTLVIPN